MSGVLCVITARGGSKRIPRKNIRDFCGKPIIAYSIEAALQSGLFDDVMVSTDDGMIADVARACGASVPFMRSAATSDDFATTADVLAEVLGVYEAQGRTFDVVCCVYPTAPFVTAGKLREAYRLLDGEHDSVMPVVRFPFPPQRGLVVRDGRPGWWFPECRDVRSQDLEPVYHDVGQFYLTEAAALLRIRSVLGDNPAIYPVSDDEAWDIDNPSDWTIAEALYERMVERGKDE